MVHSIFGPAPNPNHLAVFDGDVETCIWSME